MGLLYVFLALSIATNWTPTETGPQERRLTLAVLDNDDSELSRTAVEMLIANIASSDQFRIIDRGQVSAAVRGANYTGSLNMSLADARDLGVAIGCDFFMLVNAQALRRSPSSGPIYIDSFASIFLVSARSGKLILWERPHFKAATIEAGANLLLEELRSSTVRTRYLEAIRKAEEEERHKRETAIHNAILSMEEIPDDEASAESLGLRLPRPYRRLVPKYPHTAAQAEVEGVVDVLVNLDEQGEVKDVELARWAGFGLDEAAVETAKRLHFFPALREGLPIPIRVLLRYNFRKPQKPQASKRVVPE